MSISVQKKLIVNMAGSNKPLPMDTALKTVSEASIHVTKSDQNLIAKNHIGSESSSSSSRKNSTAENLSGELHTTASMNNVRSNISVVLDGSKGVGTSKPAGVSVTSSNSNTLASTASQSGGPLQSSLPVQRIPHLTAPDEAVVGNLSNGPGTIPAKARKSSFQITRVTGSTPGGTTAGDQTSTSGSHAGSIMDAMEDADEMTPNTGSEGHDISRSTADLSEDTETSADTLRSPNSETDGDLFLASAGAVYDQTLPQIVVPVTATTPAAILLAMAGTSTANCSTNGKSSPVAVDIQSRFKIVKILNRVRGRWKCIDFAGPPMSAAESTVSKSDSPSSVTTGMVVRMQDSGSADTLIDVSHLVSSVPSTLDGMSQNFYRMTDTNTTLSQIAGTVRSSSDPAFVVGGGVVINRSGVEANCDPSNQMLLNPAQGAESIDDTTESSIDAAGSFALDNKIEQAMVRYNDSLITLDYKIIKSLDLVKSHLMFAVHEEVELLKEQIKELTIKNGQLEYENTVLRASATSETLAKLQPPQPSAPHTGLS